MKRLKARSLAYLRRSVGKGRPYAAYRLGTKLLRQGRGIFRDDQMVSEGIDVLMAAYKAGVRQAGWGLAKAACESRAKTELPQEEIAELLLNQTIRTGDPMAALNLWYYYSQFIDAGRLKDAFRPIIKRSATIHEIMHNELRDA